MGDNIIPAKNREILKCKTWQIQIEKPKKQEYLF
jgi:hypothetical protein